jgi:hypothetical protein
MIIVHLKKSMPVLLMEKRRGVPNDVLLDFLREKTRGDWAGIKQDSIDAYGDYIVGAYEGLVVSVYKVVGDTRTDSLPEKRVVFEVEDAPEMAWMIGRQCPGGRWKRGEARPVRYFTTTEVLWSYEHEEGVTRSEMQVDDVEMDDVMLSCIEEIARPDQRVAVADASGTVLDDVEVEINPRGGIIVNVPAGTRVLIVPRVS